MRDNYYIQLKYFFFLIFKKLFLLFFFFTFSGTLLGHRTHKELL
jgi:hypothetical protein